MNDFFNDYANAFFYGFLGFLGSVVRVAVAVGRKEPMPAATIVATMISGTVFAATCNTLVGYAVGLPAGFAGAASFVCGLVGMAFAVEIIDMGLKFPKKGGGNGGA